MPVCTSPPHRDTILDLNQLASIIYHGHSRIPIFDGVRSNIRGVLLVKRLIVVNPDDRRPVRTIASRWPLICSPDMLLLDILNLFQTGRSHMAIVCDRPDVMMAALRAELPVPAECIISGIITIEGMQQLYCGRIPAERALNIPSPLVSEAGICADSSFLSLSAVCAPRSLLQTSSSC
jgi:hypothetical protein